MLTHFSNPKTQDTPLLFTAIDEARSPLEWFAKQSYSSRPAELNRPYHHSDRQNCIHTHKDNASQLRAVLLDAQLTLSILDAVSNKSFSDHGHIRHYLKEALWNLIKLQELQPEFTKIDRRQARLLIIALDFIPHLEGYYFQSPYRSFARFVVNAFFPNQSLSLRGEPVSFEKSSIYKEAKSRKLDEKFSADLLSRSYPKPITLFADPDDPVVVKSKGNRFGIIGSERTVVSAACRFFHFPRLEPSSTKTKEFRSIEAEMMRMPRQYQCW